MHRQLTVSVKKIAYRQSNAGHTVTFLLPPLGEMDATGLAKAEMGSTFKLILIPTDENDQPLLPPEAKETEPGPVSSNEPARVSKSWDELPITSRIAIRCNEVAFQKFLQEEYRGAWNLMNEGTDTERAAVFVRFKCDVQSRRDIRPGTGSFVNWMALEDQYQAWLRT